jgi:hypothetical protein
MALLTVEGMYRDGKVELAETPEDVSEATRVLVTFLPANGAQAAVERLDAAEKAKSREELLARIFARMEAALDLGGPPYPRREELYDRLKARR